MKDWDKLLVNLAKNIAAPPTTGTGKHRKLKVDEMYLYSDKPQQEEAPVVDIEEARKRREWISKHAKPPRALRGGEKDSR